MKLEDQVCSLELAKRLKELGVKQDSYFYWNETLTQKGRKGTAPCNLSGYWKLGDIPKENRNVSAFTVAELGEMLPEFVVSECEHCNRNPRGSSKSNRFLLDLRRESPFHAPENKRWYVAYWNYGSLPPHTLNFSCFTEDTEADARAKMLIYLIENNLVKP